MTRRNVLLDGEPPPPGETERFVEIPKGNDPMFAIELAADLFRMRTLNLTPRLPRRALRRLNFARRSPWCATWWSA